MCDNDDEVLTYDDCRRAGYCVDGLRRWFDRHGGDFNAFVRDGITVAQARRISDDGLLKRVVRLKNGG